jgi:hypothetical protein
MTIHELKCWPSEYEAIERGDKTFEVRGNLDRDFSVGDTLVLRKWDPAEAGGRGSYVDWSIPPIVLRVRVTHILHGGRFGLLPGLCVMAIRIEDDGNPRTSEAVEEIEGHKDSNP